MWSMIWRSFCWIRISKRLAAIQLVLLDVDGVLTDGSLFYGPEGRLSKLFNVRDGLGIRLLQNAGIEVAFLSGGRGGATEARAQHLGIRHCLVGATDKPQALTELCQRVGVAPEQIVYVGDDLNDLALRGRVGLLIATADAVEPLRRRADAVLHRKGGHGAVRELAERLLQSRGQWEQLCRQGWRDRND